MSNRYRSGDSSPAPTAPQRHQIAVFGFVGALFDKLLSQIRIAISRRENGTLYRPKHSLLRTLLRELHNCCWRMSYVYRHRPDRQGILIGPAFRIGESQNVLWDKKTLDCNKDIEHFLAVQRWRTLIDVELFREAWFLGVEWSSRNRHT